ncbi:MAG: hypothetical protein JW774_09120 [Candidatus Aureabacteria bacterium]|nr:hypothetical protein [Candidatus Auribacterota bacterium]
MNEHKLEHPLFLFISVTLILLTANGEYLFDPPYWDAQGGSFLQAAWLIENSFDYLWLFHEKGYMQGGPNVYYLNIVPLLYAVFLIFIKPALVFFILHLLNIFCTAVTCVVFYRIARSVFSSGLSVLFCFACLLNPILSGQTAGINMELYLLLFSALSIYCFHVGKYPLAVILCISAYFFKSSAIILGMAYGVFYLAESVKSLLKKEKPSFPYTLCLPVFIMVILSFVSSDSDRYFSQSNLMEKISRFQEEIVHHFPDQGLILALIIVTAVYYFFKHGLKNSFMNFLLIYTLGCYAAYSNCFWPLPRYTASYIFPAFLCSGFLLAKTFRNQLMAFLLFSSLSIFGMMNQHGKFLPKLHPQISRAGANLERSREYLTDLEANIRTCRFIENNYADAEIGVSRNFYWMLTNPFLGYVTRTVEKAFILSSDYFQSEAFDLKNADTLYLYAPHFIRPPELNDHFQILYVDQSLEGTPVVLFKKSGLTGNG